MPCPRSFSGSGCCPGPYRVLRREGGIAGLRLPPDGPRRPDAARPFEVFTEGRHLAGERVPDVAARAARPHARASEPAHSQPADGAVRGGLQPTGGTDSQVSEPQGGALPRRCKTVHAFAAQDTATGRRPEPLPGPTPEEAAAALGALQAGTAAARSAVDTEGNNPR